MEKAGRSQGTVVFGSGAEGLELKNIAEQTLVKRFAKHKLTKAGVIRVAIRTLLVTPNHMVAGLDKERGPGRHAKPKDD